MNTTPPPIKRPSRFDPKALRAAAEKLAPEVRAWIGSQSDDLESITEDLIKALKYETDGYQIAKNLESEGYDPDSQLVEILDEAFYHLQQAHDDLCKAWVLENQLQPPEIGSQVISKTRPDSGLGTIVSNYPNGKSGVRFPQLGHVETGSGTHASILPWEELEPA